MTDNSGQNLMEAHSVMARSFIGSNQYQKRSSIL
ncbi:MAG: hypothetical protein ACJA2D_000378 [Pseudohongiellaceae bacterium]|jgi:hypothetical protein